jgi:hypothetical protein
MNNVLNEMLTLTLPPLISGVLHMVFVTLNILPQIKIPIHEKSFGKNKTWRGVILILITSVFGVWITKMFEQSWGTNLLQQHSTINTGLLIGIGYAFPELPNSYWKRKKGIAPGKTSEKNILLHSIVDQADSALGVCLVYLALSLASTQVILYTFFAGLFVHFFVNIALYFLKLRKNPL